MKLVVDLRYALLPVVNLIAPIFTSSRQENFDQCLKVAVLVILFLLVVLFLFTSIRLPLTAHPISITFGYFSSSRPLLLALLGSFFLPPPFFWIAFTVIIFPTFPTLVDSYALPLQQPDIEANI